MKYCMLLWPHANVRYQNETLKLAQSELKLMLDIFAPDAEISVYEGLNMPALEIRTPDEMDARLISAIRGHSLLYALFEIRDGGLLLPVAGREEAFVGSDLPGILKYKGKTNELFLQLMTNVALYAGGFARRGAERLELLDPMCGRGTTLFVGANRGWNTTGTDVDRNDLSEAEKFLRRYFEYHRMKHAMKKEARTVPGAKSAAVTQFAFSDTPEHFKAGESCSLRLANADAARVREIFGKEKFHMIVCDLPYGVQHASVGASPEKLLRQALPGWKEALKKGGAIALSFNAQSFKTEKVRILLEEAGLEVKRGGAYDGFSHWVEQAVTRDIAVAKRTN
ncbi:MAG: hypothetical protein IJ466_08000 [Clostridia bacterium]|nr:hypothetical protein [Clostridia bacterium]